MIRNFNHCFKDRTLEIFYIGHQALDQQVVLLSRFIESKDRKAFLKLYNKLPVGMQMRCHIPHHGFRAYDENNEVVFECEICYMCNSLRFKGPAVREEFLTFMADSITAKELLEFYEDHLGPHPRLKNNLISN